MTATSLVILIDGEEHTERVFPSETLAGAHLAELLDRLEQDNINFETEQLHTDYPNEIMVNITTWEYES